MKAPSCRVTSAGDVSPWGKRFLTSLVKSNIIELVVEPSIQKFCDAFASTHPQIVLIENLKDSREGIVKIKQAGKKALLLWYGQNFSKDDFAFALENRVYWIFDNLEPEDTAMTVGLQKAAGANESAKMSEHLMRSLKSVLVQAESEISKPLMSEIKTAVMKIERLALRNEFLSFPAEQGNENEQLPFYQSPDIEDALSTVQMLERTGDLWVRGNAAEEEGAIEFLQGKIVSANAGESKSVKAIYRMFLWKEPKFSFNRKTPEECRIENHLNLSLKYICEQGKEMRRRFERIKSEIPPRELLLELEASSLHSESTFPVNQFSTLASVVEFGQVSQVLDVNPLPDVEILESLISLRKAKMIKVAA